MRIRKQIAIASMFVFIFCVLTGCFTNIAMDIYDNDVILNKDRGAQYEHRNYAVDLVGEYYGVFRSIGKEESLFHIYYIPHLPWPPELVEVRYRQDRQWVLQNGMGLIVDATWINEPIIIPQHISPKDNPFLAITEMADTVWTHEKYGARYLFSVTRKVIYDHYPVLIRISSSDEIPTRYHKLEEYDHYVHIMATKNGPGSKIYFGRTDQQGKIKWSNASVIKTRPTAGHWRSWDFYFPGIIFGVILDIVTAPLQVIYMLYTDAA